MMHPTVLPPVQVVLALETGAAEPWVKLVAPAGSIQLIFGLGTPSWDGVSSCARLKISKAAMRNSRRRPCSSSLKLLNSVMSQLFDPGPRSCGSSVVPKWPICGSVIDAGLNHWEPTPLRLTPLFGLDSSCGVRARSGVPFQFTVVLKLAQSPAFCTPPS